MIDAAASESTSKPGLRERKQERVRQDVMDAGLRLFVQQGFDATTVDQIADAAEISRRTLFRYFETKGDILMAAMRGMSDFLETSLRARPAQEAPLLSLLEIFIALSQQLATSGVDAYSLAYMIDRDPSLRQYSLQKHAEWEDRIADVLLERLPVESHLEVRARLLARIGVGSFRTALDQWLANEGRGHLKTHLVETFALLDKTIKPQALI
jgi:AcrR family transcriptional regulator